MHTNSLLAIATLANALSMLSGHSIQPPVSVHDLTALPTTTAAPVKTSSTTSDEDLAERWSLDVPWTHKMAGLPTSLSTVYVPKPTETTLSDVRVSLEQRQAHPTSIPDECKRAAWYWYANIDTCVPPLEPNRLRNCLKVAPEQWTFLVDNPFCKSMLVEEKPETIMKLDKLKAQLGDKGKAIDKNFLICSRDSCEWVATANPIITGSVEDQDAENVDIMDWVAPRCETAAWYPIPDPSKCIPKGLNSHPESCPQLWITVPAQPFCKQRVAETDEETIAKLEGMRNTLSNSGKTSDKYYLTCDRDSCEWATYDQARRPYASQVEGSVASTSGAESQTLPTPYLHGFPVGLDHIHDTSVEKPRLVSRNECANPEDCIVTAVDQILNTLKQILDADTKTLDIDKKILDLVEKPKTVPQQTLDTLNQILDTDKKTLDIDEKILDLVEEPKLVTRAVLGAAPG